MAISVKWHDPEARTIILFQPYRTWTWDDFHAAILKGLALMNTVHHPVDQVVDLDGFNMLPPGNALHNFKRAWDLSLEHVNSGKLAIVNPNPFGRTLADIFMRIYAGVTGWQRVYFFATQEKALAALIEMQQDRIPA